MHFKATLGLLALTGITTATPVDLQPRQSGNFQQQMLDAHNFFRAQHGAQPLTWNSNLASKAQAWANTCNWSHDSAGEDLAWATGYSNWGDFVNLWGAERKDYNWNKPGFSLDTGHFTQVVWKNTKTVGCGWNKCNGGAGKAKGTYVVCKYDPPGNYDGEFAQNVGRQIKGKPSDVWTKS